MKVKELIWKLKKLDPQGEILVFQDEELNILFAEFEVEDIGSVKNKYVIFGLSGSEVFL